MDKKDKNPNVPNLRFENTPFYYDLIGHQFEIITGGTPSTKNKNYWKGDIPWMPSGDINKKYIFDVSKSISELGLTNSSAKMVPYHSVLIALAGQGKTRGTSAILEMNCCINQSLAAILPNNKFNPYYIFHYLESKYDDLRLISSGDGGRGGLNKELISNYKISYPTLPEQNKIADFFNKIDERIQAQIKIINDLVLQKKCIISSLLKSVQDNEKIMLKDILFDYNIKTTINNEYPVLSSTASGMYLQSEYFNKEASSDNTIGYKIIPRGYCTYRSMSDTGLFTFNMQELVEKGIVSPAYPVFSANDDYINEFIILYLNNSSYIKKQILELKSGGTRFALPFSTLCTLKIPKLGKEKQLSLNKTITAFERKIENEEMILKALHQQKNFLLNNMFI